MAGPDAGRSHLNHTQEGESRVEMGEAVNVLPPLRLHALRVPEPSQTVSPARSLWRLWGSLPFKSPQPVQEFLKHEATAGEFIWSKHKNMVCNIVHYNHMVIM